MRRLMLLRHAKSDRSDPGMRDFDRPLNGRGREEAPLIGAYLAHHALIPDLAVVSAALRTRETWEQIVAALPHAPPASFDERLYEATAGHILDLVRQTRPEVHALLLVGHNPGLHDLARRLIATGDIEAREHLAANLPTSGLVVIDFPADDWRSLKADAGRLDRFVTARRLAGALD